MKSNRNYKLNFMTFGGPTEGYRKRVEIISDQARSFNMFDNIYGFTDKDLQNDEEFWNKHSTFMLNNRRGFGYWVWKPHLLLKILNQMNEGDVLVYSDAGCTLNNTGLARFNEYLNILEQSESGILNFELTHPEYKYTKNDLFEYLNASENIKYKFQILSGIFLIRKNTNTVNLVQKWKDIYDVSYHYAADTPSVSKNHPEFVEHRHDQSIFSILCRQNGCVTLPDESYYPDFSLYTHIPIVATRIRS